MIGQTHFPKQFPSWHPRMAPRFITQSIFLSEKEEFSGRGIRQDEKCDSNIKDRMIVRNLCYIR